jgi:hypothetical protein
VRTQDQVDTLDKVLDAQHNDTERLWAMYTDATGAGHNEDAMRWHALFQTSKQAMPAMRADRDKLMDEFDKQHIPYLLKCMLVHRRLRTDYRKLQARIRVEIEVDDDAFDNYPTFDHAADVQDRRFVRHMRKQFPDHHELILDLAKQAGCDLGEDQ